MNKKPNNNATFRKRKKKEAVEEYNKEYLETLYESHIVLLKKPSNIHPKAKFLCKICSYHSDDIDRALKHKGDSKHQNNLKKLFMKNLMGFLPNPSQSHKDALNDYCNKIFFKSNYFIPDNEINRRKTVVFEMNKVAMEINSEYRLNICGSLLTGLSLDKTSDVNLYFQLDENLSDDISYLDELGKLSDAIKKTLKMNTEIVLDKSNSGLICYDKNQVIYHISSSYKTQQLTSSLIRVYLKIDQRAEKLAKLFRYFARESFIDNWNNGFFHSQVFAILVVYYLQQLSIPILPNLHKLAKLDSVNSNCTISMTVRDKIMSYVNDIDEVRKLWSPPTNHSTLAELWIGLLKFYAVEFNCSTYIISLTSHEPVLKVQRGLSNKRLFVEDPFDFKRNLIHNWNTQDVIEYFYDQLEFCLTYFAVPQIVKEGPAFKKINFLDINNDWLDSFINVQLNFSKTDASHDFSLLENELKLLFDEESSIFNITKWPTDSFIRMVIGKYLKTMINIQNDDIKRLLWLLDVKNKLTHYFLINNYGKFKQIAMELVTLLDTTFTDHLTVRDLWTSENIRSNELFILLKRIVNKFFNQTKEVSDKLDDTSEYDVYEDEEQIDFDEDEEEENDEIGGDSEEEVDNQEIGDSNVISNDLIDLITDDAICETPLSTNSFSINDSVCNSDSWKIPIEFKEIVVRKKGFRQESDDPTCYNEVRINSLTKEQLQFDFAKMPNHKRALEVTCNICNTKSHRRDNCPSAIPRNEHLKNIIDKIDFNWLNSLNEILHSKYKDTTISGDRLNRIKNIFSNISKMITKIFPNCVPKLFGSTNNGFMTRASDLDICLEFQDDNKKRCQLNNKTISDNLRTIGQRLEKCFGKIRVEYILKAKVPIIKFSLPNENVQGDISINNSLALHNTEMLKLYGEIDDSVKVLGNLIKYVAKSCGIGDASQGTLSSYAYIILLIHFLQKRNVLPVLQELYEGNEKPRVMIEGWNAWYQNDLAIVNKLWKKNNVQSLPYLWLDFFYYYAVEFDISKEVVTIRQSKKMYKIDKDWQYSFLAIEDPFDLSHNLAGSLLLDNCRYILQCFAHVLKLHGDNQHMGCQQDVNRLLIEPEALNPGRINPKACFKCNKVGHVARDCPVKIDNKKPNKLNDIDQQQILAQKTMSQFITSPLITKPTLINGNYHLDFNLNEVNKISPVPLSSFVNNMDNFAMIPITLQIGEYKVMVPVLADKSNCLSEVLKQLDSNPQINSKIPTMFLTPKQPTQINNPVVNPNFVTPIPNINHQNRQVPPSPNQMFPNQAMFGGHPIRSPHMTPPNNMRIANPIRPQSSYYPTNPNNHIRNLQPFNYNQTHMPHNQQYNPQMYNHLQQPHINNNNNNSNTNNKNYRNVNHNSRR